VPYKAPNQRTMLTPEGIVIEKLDGTMVAERHAAPILMHTSGVVGCPEGAA
jgi:hypothetical protein